MSSYAGASVLVESGAEFNIANNTCARNGAGAFLRNAGTSLTVTGIATRFYMLNNTVACSSQIATSYCGGGGLSVGPGASASITSPSLFRGNRADAGAGGAVELHGVGKNDGAGACVSVKLDISANENSTKKSAGVYFSSISTRQP